MGKTIGLILALQDKCSPNIKKVAEQIGITEKEVANVFDGEFGPASDELPLEVRFDDFYVAKFPDTGGGGTGTLLTSGRTGAAAVFTELFTSGGTVSTFRGCSEKNCFISSDDGEIPGR